jgi:LacI family transcriptional regulator
MMRVTIKDVSRASGLSVSTVSRALNSSGYVSEETRQRVTQAAEELGYRPNWIARSLKGKPSCLVGLIIPDISNVYYTSIASFVSKTLRENNYELILCNSHEDPEVDLAYLKMLHEKRVDGVIYVHPSRGDNSTYVRRMVADGMPIVELNRQKDHELLDCVMADNRQGSFKATRYMIELGHQQIGLILGETSLVTGRDRLFGYRDALESAGIAYNQDLVRIGSFSRDHGEQGMRDLLQLSKLPTAVFAGSNRILTGVLYVLGQEGICIPQDLSVISFDDAEWVSIWNPSITVVDIAIEEISRLAVELLYRRINNKELSRKPITYLLSTHLIERNSCHPVSLPMIEKG